MHMTASASVSAADLTAVVLAGGRGERLGGVDKATLVLAGQSLLRRALSQVEPLVEHTIVVLRADQSLPPDVEDLPLSPRIVRDQPGMRGVLPAIATGLAASTTTWSLVVACDMPFLQPALLRYMLTLRRGHDIVVPRLPVGLEPLHALYRRTCSHPAQSAAIAGQRRVISFYAGLRVRYVDAPELAVHDPQGRSFANINTPDDLALARARLEAER